MLNRLLDWVSQQFPRRSLLILGMCSLLAAAAGPFGTYEAQTFSTRLLYWFLVSAISIVVGGASHGLARKLVDETHPIRTDLVMILIMVVLFTPILWALTHSLLLQGSSAGPTIHRLSYYVAAVTLGICVSRRVLPGFEEIPYFGKAAEEKPEAPRLARRLSPSFEGSIQRLTVRDHLVEVVGTSGSESIRMRFADAIDEMDTVVGHCTHRSHWVARDAIVGVERSAGKVQIKLANGDLVPVSRKYKLELEELGIV